MSAKLVIPDCLSCVSKCKSIFSEIPKEILSEINVHKNANFYKKGQVVFMEGNPAFGVFVVHQGKVKISCQCDNGKERILRFATTGDTLGYRSIIVGDKYEVTATTIEDSVICFIPKRIFLDLLQETKFSMKVLNTLFNEIKQQEQAITEFFQKGVKERMAEALLILKESFGTEADGQTLNIIVSREDLASYIGVTTETAIRTLSELRKDKIIAIDKKKIKILDSSKLVNIGLLYD